MEIKLILLIIFGVISGLSHGVTVTPIPRNSAPGWTVWFTSTVSNSTTPFQSVSWTFTADGTTNPVFIVNAKPGAVLIGSNYDSYLFTANYSTASLEIRNMQPRDSGVYSVTIKTAEGDVLTGDSGPVKIHNLDSVSGTLTRLTPSLLNGAVGESVTFPNPLTVPGASLQSVSWMFTANGNTHPVYIISSITGSPDIFGPGYEDRITFDRSTASLVVKNLALSDSGVYSVYIVPAGGDTLQTANSHPINIYNRISGVSITASPNRPVEGNSVILTCDVAAGSVPTREWRKDGSPLDDDITVYVEGKLLFFRLLKRTHSGEYSCNVSNPVSSEEVKYNMVVNYGPESVQITGPSDIEVGQILALTCSAESIPTARYIWMLNGCETQQYSAVFTKPVTEFSDSGNYTCQAKNEVTGKTTSAIHTLSVKSKGPYYVIGLTTRLKSTHELSDSDIRHAMEEFLNGVPYSSLNVTSVRRRA